MAQAEYSVAMKSDIPVIFTAVTDPVAAELANADGTPVGEIAGTSDKLPVEQQLKMIREILPDAKTIGIMYTTSEVNSESLSQNTRNWLQIMTLRSLIPVSPLLQIFLWQQIL